MSLPLSPSAATQAVIWGGLFIGLALGAVAQGHAFFARWARWPTGSATAACRGWPCGCSQWPSRRSARNSSSAWPGSTRPAPWPGAIGSFGCRTPWAARCSASAWFSPPVARSAIWWKAGAGSLKAWVTLVVAAVTAQMTLRGVPGRSARRCARRRWRAARAPARRRVDARAAARRQRGGLAHGGARARAHGGRPAALARPAAAWTAATGSGGAVVGVLVPVAWLLTGTVGFLPEHPGHARSGVARHRLAPARGADLHRAHRPQPRPAHASGRTATPRPASA